MGFNELKSLLKRDRSIRKFDERRKIDVNTIREIVELVRYCASGRNLQPLRYRIVTELEQVLKMHALVKWAGYLNDWNGPEDGERPVAYLVQCLDTKLTTDCMCDEGLQLQTITLGATAINLGCCIIKSFNAPGVIENLHLDSRYIPTYVIAIGYPIENVVIENTDGKTEADIKYYRTPDNHSRDAIHHVPKRPLNELII